MNARVLPILAVSALILATAAGCSGANSADKTTDTVTPSYAAVARGQIEVRGGLLSVVSPVQGTVARIGVHEGDRVHAGQMLASLQETQARAALDNVKAQLEQARAQEKLLQLQRQSGLKQARRETAAAAAGAGASQAADDANAKVAELGAQLDAARANTAMIAAKLKSARYALSQHVLRAPVDAFVLRVKTQKGANISQASGELFKLLPDRPHIVRAELNASYLSAIHPGMHASVSLEDDQNGKTWQAHVVRVGRVLSTSELDEDPTTRATQRTVVCVLDFDKPSGLRIGRRVLVRFLPEDKGKH
ncbi:HlyD family efflux transporter periplasmic adaptor subunit [Oleiagrimonas sp.]|jgi:multidrug resistance efflux pump|uniref:HlyD family secretion protein n=1 Tax=Oleiagrimonas sp. TaxID=2010330 RepID=UPI0026246417|nr:HlyD family efflux transporter periplasmic adaptor subunit [Oleiagrimonas sp.]MDA3914480.1 HlyD family efflux transporter periplasmic adaptor subunit [Oleiagrimonas sp.]